MTKTALELIQQGWTQGALARNTLGFKVGYDSYAAVCWCASGAIGAAYGTGHEYYPALKRLLDVVGTTSILSWNDDPTRTKEDVVEAFVNAGI